MSRLLRGGFSLMEVLVAMAILMGSSVVLFHLAGVGARHTSEAQKLADAQWCCQTKLSEILAGVIPLEPVRDRPVEQRPGWVYSIDVLPLDQPDAPVAMALLEVTVAEAPEREGDRANVQFTLHRWIGDPRVADQSAAAGGAAVNNSPEAPAEDTGEKAPGEDLLP